jgi:hypothetical protein
MRVDELVATALRGETEPPRVPSFVQGVMPNFERAWDDRFGDDVEESALLLTDLKDMTLHAHLGFDSTWCGFGGPAWKAPEGFDAFRKRREAELLTPDQQADGYYLNTNGGVYHHGTLAGHAYTYLVDGSLKNYDEWKEWFGDWEFVEAPDRTLVQYERTFETAINFSRPVLPIPSVGLLVEPLLGSFSIARIGYLTRRQPAEFRRILDHIMRPTLGKMKLLCESSAPCIIMPDDCAYKGRPILSPGMYREFIIPHVRQMAAMARKADKILFLHSDGFVEPYYDDLIAAGLHGHQSLEPTAGMDLAHLKEKYGDRFALIGNMDCSRLLPFGSPQEVVEATKKCLRDGSPGGRYMFSPCTDLTDSCRLENAVAMMGTFKKYCNYPVTC